MFHGEKLLYYVVNWTDRCEYKDCVRSPDVCAEIPYRIWAKTEKPLTVSSWQKLSLKSWDTISGFWGLYEDSIPPRVESVL